MSKKDDFKKKFKQIKKEIEDGVVSSDEELQNKVNDLLEMISATTLKDKILEKIFTYFNFIISMFMSFCISYAFSVNIFNLENKWLILVIFLIMTGILLVEKIFVNFFKMNPQNYILGIFGLFNITLFTAVNFFFKFTSNIVLFNSLYCLGFGLYFIANFILMRRKFKKVLE